MIGKVLVFIVGLTIAECAPVAAQAPQPQPPEQVQSQPAGRRPVHGRLDQLRYQIGTMERVLETAVEHGASVWRDRLQSVLPAQTLLLDTARARGYRLEEYGVFFDVEVPSVSFETTLLTALQTLDQNGLGLQDALNRVKALVRAAGDPNAEQALKRIELQVVPNGALAAADTVADATPAPIKTDDAPDDPILSNPKEAYRAEVKQAVIEAMLDHSGPLNIAPNEWLTVGASSSETRPRIGLESNVQTFIFRVRGSDLAAFRAGQLSREDAIKRVEVRVF